MPRIINRIPPNQSSVPLLAAQDQEVIAEPPCRLPGALPPEAVAAYAYHIWEQEGRPVGREREHWLQAETQLRWVLLADDLLRPASQSSVRRKLWDQSTSRFGPGRPARAKHQPAKARARR